MPIFQLWMNGWAKGSTKQGHADTGTSGSQGRSRSRQHTKGLSHPNGYPTATTKQEKTPYQHRDHNVPNSSISSGEATLSTHTEAFFTDPHAVTDPELAAYVKFSSRKHKRRLHRTNSPSDIIRKQVNERSGRGSGLQFSVELPHYEGPRETFRSRERRRRNNNRHRQPPPTLHHPMDPEDLVDEFSDSSSNQSPNQQMAGEGEEEEDNIDANVLLFNVAELFGTKIPESRVRANMALSGARHMTHTGQHGVEDEQPHYLRPYMDEHIANPLNSNNNILHTHRPQLSPPPTNSYETPIYNNSIKDAKPKALHRRSHSLHDTYHASQPIPHEREDPRIPPPPLQIRQPKAKNASIAVPPIGGAREVAIRPTEPTTMGLVVGGVRLPFFSQNVAATAATADSTDSISETKDATLSGVGKPSCSECKVAQAELRRAYDSLEYMRTMAIRKEFTCHKCGSAGEPAADADTLTSKGNTQGNKKSTSVRNTSDQLVEVTSRHKKQVEQLMKERNHWQRKSHLKLEKFANLCHNLNNESSQRVEESQALKEELEIIRAERDQMASELVPLRTAVKDFEKEREEHRLVKERLALCEHEGLHQAKEAIAQRDEMIAMLSIRLETALDTLAVEREQQRQRRQIIFPPKAINGSYSTNGVQQISAGQGNSIADNAQRKEIESLRVELAEARRRLEAANTEAKQRETLEGQVQKNSATSGTTPDPTETHPLSGKNRWELS